MKNALTIALCAKNALGMALCSLIVLCIIGVPAI